jgi:ribosome biogenesis protein MAK21
VVYSGDPLHDLVLGSFLDRFAEKKPKARKQKEDGSFHASAMAVPTKTVTFVQNLFLISTALKQLVLFWKLVFCIS